MGLGSTVFGGGGAARQSSYDTNPILYNMAAWTTENPKANAMMNAGASWSPLTSGWFGQGSPMISSGASSGSSNTASKQFTQQTNPFQDSANSLISTAQNMGQYFGNTIPGLAQALGNISSTSTTPQEQAVLDSAMNSTMQGLASKYENTPGAVSAIGQQGSQEMQNVAAQLAQARTQQIVPAAQAAYNMTMGAAQTPLSTQMQLFNANQAATWTPVQALTGTLNSIPYVSPTTTVSQGK